MKRFIMRHIFIGNMAMRSDDEFFDMADKTMSVRPERLRWFCGTQDMASTFICQAL